MSRSPSIRRAAAAALALLCLAACNPRLDWREVHSTRVPYAVAFPAKPAEQTREAMLGTQKLAMTMHSAQVDGVLYSSAVATFADEAAARAGVAQLQQTLVANLKGRVLDNGVLQAKLGQGIKFRAAGTRQETQAVILHAQLIQYKQHVFQLAVLGPPKQLTPEALDTFFTSFKIE